WVDHFRRGDGTLRNLLEEGEVVSHQYVTGELACGFLKNRKDILTFLSDLATVDMPDEKEVLIFIERRDLYGQGLGYIDVSLLAACLLNGVQLYTRDERLRSAA